MICNPVKKISDLILLNLKYQFLFRVISVKGCLGGTGENKHLIKLQPQHAANTLI